jgi:hypothetical protein
MELEIITWLPGRLQAISVIIFEIQLSFAKNIYLHHQNKMTKQKQARILTL